MPAKNRIKQYIENSYYHIYNRGVEKRIIFLDQQDVAVFLSYLKEYLLPKYNDKLSQILTNPAATPQEKDQALRALRLNNFSNEITLLAYCLMPNHFHFLIRQKNPGSIDGFMNSLCTRYTMYFNKKYKRVGALYQGVYKAVLIVTDEQLLHLSRYIHQQAINSNLEQEIQPCSYGEYLKRRETDWIKPEEILNYFSQTNPSLSYQSFIKEVDDLSSISKLILDND